MHLIMYKCTLAQVVCCTLNTINFAVTRPSTFLRPTNMNNWAESTKYMYVVRTMLLILLIKWSLCIIILLLLLQCSLYCKTTHGTKKMWSYTAHAAGGPKIKVQQCTNSHFGTKIGGLIHIILFFPLFML